MFTDRLDLPLQRQRLTEQDQVLQLFGISWQDYEQITQINSGYRISYFEGTVTLVSPSRNHEAIAQIISILIVAYCRKYNLLYYPMGSTTLKNPFTVGKEPDTSYSFGKSKELPDLAVEVIFSSGSLKDLQKYKSLAIKEVWFWQNKEIEFYQLVGENYQQVESSFCLNGLKDEFLIEFVNRGLDESPLNIERDFFNRLT